MEIIYKSIKLYYIDDYPSKEKFGIGGCLITHATEENANKIMTIMSDIRNKTMNFLFGMNPEYKPGWYKEDIKIDNNLYCGCWPFETKKLDDETYVVKLYYDRKEEN